MTSNRPPAYPNVPPPYPQRGSATPARVETRDAGAAAALAPPPLPGDGRARVVVRPTSVKVLSLLGIIHASWIMAGVVLGLVMMLAPGDPKFSTMAVMKADSFLHTWSIGSSVVSLLLAVLLLLASIALRPMRSWARKGMIFWALAWLFLSAAGLVINLAYVYPLLEKSGRVTQESLMVAKLMGALSGVVLGIAWPGVIVFFLREKTIKEAFERAAVAGKAAII